MKSKLIIPFAFILVFAIAFASAEVETSGPYKWNKPAVLTQICGNCTFVNITAITLPINGSYIFSTPISMTKADTLYNYTLTKTNELGRYIITYKHDLNGVNDIDTSDFYVTTTGLDIPVSLLFLIVGLVYTIVLLGVFKRDITITLLGTILMFFIGLFMLQFGFNIYKNWLTEAFSFVTLGIAAYLSIVMAHEYIQ